MGTIREGESEGGQRKENDPRVPIREDDASRGSRVLMAERRGVRFNETNPRGRSEESIGEYDPRATIREGGGGGGRFEEAEPNAPGPWRASGKRPIPWG